MMKKIILKTAALILVFFLSCYSMGEERIYFGNLHSHTNYSDGTGTPEEAYRYAYNEGGLDFLAITDHNHQMAGKMEGEKYSYNIYEGPDGQALIPTANRLNQELAGKFVALYGQEFSTIELGNHVNVFEVPKLITAPNGKFDKLLDWIEDHPDSTNRMAIIQLNHPREYRGALEYGKDDFKGSESEWIESMGKKSYLIEVLNGPAKTQKHQRYSAKIMESDYFDFLKYGFHIAPTGNQDNHYSTWGTATDARTGVIANSLTKEEIMKALRSRHVYATQDKNLKMIFHVNDHLCGDRIKPNMEEGTELVIDYSIEDSDEPEANYNIVVYSGIIGQSPPSIVKTATDNGNTPQGTKKKISKVKYTGVNQFVLFKLIQEDPGGFEDCAWTAPVWFDAKENIEDEEESETGGESEIVASRNSRLYHVSLECSKVKSIKKENRVYDEEAMKNRSMHAGCPTK